MGNLNVCKGNQSPPCTGSYFASKKPIGRVKIHMECGNFDVAGEEIGRDRLIFPGAGNRQPAVG